MAIQVRHYNQARSILTRAGSRTAGVSHPAHNQPAVPDNYGVQLLQEARNEFRRTDGNQNNLRSGVTQAHYDAIHQAARVMGISRW